LGEQEAGVQLTIPGRPKPYVMAHRGNSVACPENTLAAFRRAFVDGADLLETDLHLTADGVLVCIHDATVDRTTDGHGPVAGMTLAKLKRLSASYGRSEFAGERIPTLDETIALLPPDAVLALELKTDRFLEPTVARLLAGRLEDAGMATRTVVLSFHLPRVLAVKAVAPHVPAGFITIKRPIPKSGVQLLGPFWPLLLANPFYVAWAHARGQLVCPLDTAPEPRLWYYRMLDCDAVMTNDPEATVRALRRA
jgi:glycerophosphoryl diester phosphodiesterase